MRQSARQPMLAGLKTRIERMGRRGVAGPYGPKKAVIAQEAGCGERHVRTILAEEATQILIRNLLRPYRENLRRLIPRVICAVDRGLQAQKATRSDIATQMLAVRRARDLLVQHEGR